MSQGSLDPKIRFLCQKVGCVSRVQTDRHTYRHESEYRGHSFRVSWFFSFILLSRIGPTLLMSQIHYILYQCFIFFNKWNRYLCFGFSLIKVFIQHPHVSSLAPSANHLQINQRILSRQKSNGMNVITSGGRSRTQQICLYVGGGRYIFN